MCPIFVDGHFRINDNLSDFAEPDIETNSQQNLISNKNA